MGNHCGNGLLTESVDDLKQCGENMNIRAKKCSEIIEEVRAVVRKWPEFAEDAGLPEDECESIRKVLLV